jgi:hypothetical protein
MQEKGLFIPRFYESVTNFSTIAAVSLSFSVSAFAAPVTHQDQGFWEIMRSQSLSA